MNVVDSFLRANNDLDWAILERTLLMLARESTKFRGVPTWGIGENLYAMLLLNESWNLKLIRSIERM